MKTSLSSTSRCRGVFFFVAALAVSLFASPTPLAHAAENWVYPNTVLEWDLAAKTNQENAARKLVGDLSAAIQRNDATFVIPPGDYRLAPEQMPFVIDSASNLEIQATDVHFWFNGRTAQAAFVFKNCTGVRFKGATFDADPFCNSQGEVISIDTWAKSLVVKIDPGFPVPDASWLGKPGSIKAAFYDPSGAIRPTMLDWIKDLQPMGERRLEVKFLNNQLFKISNQVAPGDRLVFPDRSKGHVVTIENSQNMTFEDVTIYASPHMAFVESGGDGGNTYRRCRVIKRPDTRRLIACNADVFHSIQVKNGPLIENCEFSAACDDLVNVHSFASLLFKQISPTKAIIVSFFLPDMEKGGVLEFYDFDDMSPQGRATVTSVSPRPDLALEAQALPRKLLSEGKHIADIFGKRCFPCEVEWDQPLKLTEFSIAFANTRVARNTRIRNNFFHDTTARGILLKSDGGEINDNRIERTGLPAIALAVDHHFLEGPIPRNILVTGNQIAEAAFAQWARNTFNGMNAAIVVRNVGEHGVFAPEGRPISGIAIKNNRILRPPCNAILLGNASHCAISGNEIRQAGWLSPLPGSTWELSRKAFGIYLSQSGDILLENNSLSESFPSCKGLIGFGRDTDSCGPQR